MDYGHGSSLTDLLRPREEMQAQPREALATTKCQVDPREPIYQHSGLLQDAAYFQTTTSLHPQQQQQQQQTVPQHCLGLDIVASHLTSSHLGGGQQVHLNSRGEQLHLNSGGGAGGGHHHLTRPRQQSTLFSSLSSTSSSSSPPTNNAQHYSDFQFAPEPLSPPESHHHLQYTLPCNRRLSQPATVHLENAWSHLEPPERFSKKASESTKQGGQSKVHQQQQQPRKAPLPPLSKLHLSQL